jgi:hypothetical protein
MNPDGISTFIVLDRVQRLPRGVGASETHPLALQQSNARDPKPSRRVSLIEKKYGHLPSNGSSNTPDNEADLALEPLRVPHRGASSWSAPFLESFT